MNGDPTATPSVSGRLPSLDGLRAVAIALVIYSHATVTQGFPSWLRAPLPDGGVAVRLFFVISGFLITSLLIAERNATGHVSLGRFYWRRAVRILPAYWAFLGTLALLVAFGLVRVPWMGLIQPLTFSNGMVRLPRGTIPWMASHTWSLAVEEQFYLAWPIAFALVHACLPRRWATAALSLALLALLVAGPVARARMYLRPWEAEQIYSARGNADILAWGCALAVAWDAVPTAVDRVLRWRPAWGRAMAAVTVYWAPWYFGRTYGFRFGWSAWGAQAAAMAYLVGSLAHVRRGLSFRLLNRRAMVAVGVLSYSLYLWQQPFMTSASASPPLWTRWPLNLGCAAATATASYLLIERPARRLKRLWPAPSTTAAPAGHAREKSARFD